MAGGGGFAYLIFDVKSFQEVSKKFRHFKECGLSFSEMFEILGLLREILENSGK